jgi:glucarate dehydratase
VKITDIRATTVSVPLEAPLRHANGCHWGRFVRTIVEVETDNGIIGLGEMGGGGESAESVFRAMKSYLVGHDPARLEEMRFLIANPTASLYNNRTQILAALEFACLDILGQAWNVPIFDILGGKLRDSVPFASYCFFRFAHSKTGVGEIRTIEQVVENALDLKRRYGFTTHKMKAGVFHPDHEVELYRALAQASRTTKSGLTRTPLGRPSRRSALANGLKGLTMITSKIRFTVSTACVEFARWSEFRLQRTRSS